MTKETEFDENDPALTIAYFKGFELDHEAKKVKPVYLKVFAKEGIGIVKSVDISEEEYRAELACQLLHAENEGEF